ncbi:MAG: ATP-binding protein [Methanopyri archaeon]|nr:ATP-binding protein [Methanopyri archaeon]
MITRELVRSLLQESRIMIERECVPRTLLDEVLGLIDARQAIIVTGVRRCGKSVFMRLVAHELLRTVPEGNVLYLNLEDERLSDIGVEGLDRIYELFREINLPEGRVYLFLDEVQNVERWEKWIARRYEQGGIKFFLSGSNASLLSSELATALTGRNIAFKLMPFSFTEFLLARGVSLADEPGENVHTDRANVIRHWFDIYLEWGGFPEAALSDDDVERRYVLQGYFADIIRRDILFRHGIREVRHFERLVKYLITNLARPYSSNKLAKAFDYSVNTILRYVSHVEESFLLSSIDFFSYSLKKQSRRPRKVYCIDNGLRNAVSLRFSRDAGRLAENLVHVELVRRGLEHSYWKGEGEVDFVVRDGDELTAINVTFTDEVDEREVRALEEFRDAFPDRVRDLVLITRDLYEGGSVRKVPLWRWLLFEGPGRP